MSVFVALQALSSMSAYIYASSRQQRKPCLQLRFCAAVLLLQHELDGLFPRGDADRGKKPAVFSQYWTVLAVHLPWLCRYAPIRAFVCEKNEELFKTLKLALRSAAHCTGAKRLVQVRATTAWCARGVTWRVVLPPMPPHSCTARPLTPAVHIPSTGDTQDQDRTHPPFGRARRCCKSAP